MGGRCPAAGGNITATLTTTAVMPVSGGGVASQSALIGHASATCADGRFLASFLPQPPGTAHHVITVSSAGGNFTAVASDVVFGTVILCGGQS